MLIKLGGKKDSIPVKVLVCLFASVKEENTHVSFSTRHKVKTIWQLSLLTFCVQGQAEIHLMKTQNVISFT